VKRAGRLRWCWTACLPGIVASGCATYQRVDESFAHRDAGLRIDLPADWLRYTPDKASLTLTRDGLELERITIAVHQLDEPLPGTRRAIHADMSPHEIAELLLGLAGHREETKHFVIRRIGLTRVCGREAFRAEADYVTPAGLPARMIAVGFVAGDWVFDLRFIAAAHVYFEKYAPVFDRMLASARVGLNAAGRASPQAGQRQYGSLKARDLRDTIFSFGTGGQAASDTVLK
jgi:hypothetical protein